MQPIEIVKTDKVKVSCDGGGGASGHPLVFLTINEKEKNYVDCPYCGKRFELKAKKTKK